MLSRNNLVSLIVSVSIGCMPLAQAASDQAKAGAMARMDSNRSENISDDGNGGGSGAKDIKGLSPTYISCLKSANGKVLGSDACMSDELKYQDARLNKTYKALLGALKPDSKKALVEAERAWVQLNSRDEDFESALFGDTQAENAQQLENKLYRVCARANTLEKYLAFAQL